jgi:hypothetical protein
VHGNTLEDRHHRKCQLCRHPDCEEIEDAFIDWGSPHGISCHYNLPPGSLWRHASAVGLYARRKGNVLAALDNILERSCGARVTGETVIRAVRAYICLTADNQWAEPPPASSSPFRVRHPSLPPAHPRSCRLHR